MKKNICTILFFLLLISSLVILTGCSPKNSASTGSITGECDLPDKCPDTEAGGTTIYLNGTSYKATTSADGTFSITDVPVGTYTLSYYRLGYELKTVEVHVFGDSTTMLDSVTLS